MTATSQVLGNIFALLFSLPYHYRIQRPKRMAPTFSLEVTSRGEESICDAVTVIWWMAPPGELSVLCSHRRGEEEPESQKALLLQTQMTKYPTEPAIGWESKAGCHGRWPAHQGLKRTTLRPVSPCAPAQEAAALPQQWPQFQDFLQTSGRHYFLCLWINLVQLLQCSNFLLIVYLFY